MSKAANWAVVTLSGSKLTTNQILPKALKTPTNWCSATRSMCSSAPCTRVFKWAFKKLRATLACCHSSPMQVFTRPRVLCARPTCSAPASPTANPPWHSDKPWWPKVTKRLCGSLGNMLLVTKPTKASKKATPRQAVPLSKSWACPSLTSNSRHCSPKLQPLNPMQSLASLQVLLVPSS